MSASGMMALSVGLALLLLFLGLVDQVRLEQRREAQRRELVRREADARRRMETALRTGVIHYAYEDDVAVCIEQGVAEPCEDCVRKAEEPAP